MIVPKLGELFSKLGVNRVVGITHTAKYFKETFSTVYIEEDDVKATYANIKGSPAMVLGIAVQHYSTYKFPNKADFKKSHSKMVEKYCHENAPSEFQTKTLTYRSPLFLDIIESGGAFSIEYLAAGFEAYKSLKTKHANTVQNLDALLGIR